jgi:hypothetical protein
MGGLGFFWDRICTPHFWCDACMGDGGVHDRLFLVGIEQFDWCADSAVFVA